MNVATNTQTLVEAFSALADQVQGLTDRKTILEHKLRFAHEQFQYLADKYAPAAPEISEAIVKLQLPSSYSDHPSVNDASVPLPRRNGTVVNASHQIALLIRDGRRAASQLAASSTATSAEHLPDRQTLQSYPRLSLASPTLARPNLYSSTLVSPHSHAYTHPYVLPHHLLSRPPALSSSISTCSKPATTAHSDSSSVTSMSTVLEKDFTVEGKRGELKCPFSTAASTAQRPPGHSHVLNSQYEDVVSKADAANKHTSISHSASAVDLGSLSAHPHDPPGPPQARRLSFAPTEGSLTRHPPAADPICAALAGSEAGTGSQADPSSKCPIRYLDKHSPEEVAQYVEKYKHQIPRSHEICVRKYQANEEQVRKLDAKYGDLASMIAGLSTLHKPMLTEEQKALQAMQTLRAEVGDKPEEAPADQTTERSKNDRVKSWAQQVGQTIGTDTEGNDADDEEDTNCRESRFDRPLKEVRVGESPSRPWGISVPVTSNFKNSLMREPGEDALSEASTLPIPVNMPRKPETPGRKKPEVDTQGSNTPIAREPDNKGLKKCPFDHAKLAAMGFTRPRAPKPDELAQSSLDPSFTPATPTFSQQQPQQQEASPPQQPSTCPMSHNRPDVPQSSTQPPLPLPAHGNRIPNGTIQPTPTFINMSNNIGDPPTVVGGSAPAIVRTQVGGAQMIPQMVFTGPVFIGYPVEDAMKVMQTFHMGQQQQAQ